MTMSTANTRRFCPGCNRTMDVVGFICGRCWVELPRELRYALRAVLPGGAAHRQACEQATSWLRAHHNSVESGGGVSDAPITPPAGCGRFAELTALVVKITGVPMVDLATNRRTAPVVKARHMLAYLLHEYAGMSYPEISAAMHVGHGTAVEGSKQAEQAIIQAGQEVAA